MKISLDTNILIDSPEIVFDETREFVISFKVIQELDNHKRNPDLKRAAQQALKNIRFQVRKKKVEIINMPTELGDSPDEIIIQDTKDAGASFLTADFGAELIADAFGIDISGFEADDDIDYNYTGMITIQGDLNYEQDYKQIKEMQLEEFNTQFDVDLKENQYCIIDRMVEKNDIWVNTAHFCEEIQEVKHTVKRISQSMGPLKDSGVMKVPLDDEQMCALHAVMDKTTPLTIIDGSLGCLVAGEQLDVEIDPVIVDKKVLYKHICDNTGATTDLIRQKLKTLRKYKIISDENDLTEFGPSLLIYFKLDKNKTLAFNNDRKFSSKYLHFRYWLSYFDYDIDMAFSRTKFLRSSQNIVFFEGNLSEEYNLDNHENIIKIRNLLLLGEEIDFRGSGRLSIDYWLFRGWTKEESIDFISNIQRNNSHKKLKKYTSESMRKFSPRCIEYWENKGYNKTESRERVKKVQNTFSLEKCILKYGKDIGIEIFNKRQEKWHDSLGKLTEDEKQEIKFKQASSNSSMYENWDEYKNKPGTLYYMRFYNDTEEFWKVGITSKSIKERFGSIELFNLKHNLKYEILSEQNMTIREAFIEEQRILKENKKSRTIINYNGFKTTEAFVKDIK